MTNSNESEVQLVPQNSPRPVDSGHAADKAKIINEKDKNKID
jgi:hypothetical protein